jgi:hypothetical protein
VEICFLIFLIIFEFFLENGVCLVRLDINRGGKKMNKKSFLVFVFIALFTVSLLSAPAQAGSAQRYRWEGVAIGIGAAILGSAFLHHNRQDAYYGRHRHGSEYGSYHPRQRYRSGHWEVRKEWVPPTYRRVRNPGHYNQYDEWVPGGWIVIVDRPGYWTKTRVWVAHR